VVGAHRVIVDIVPADVDLIVPVLNEAGALPWLLGRVPNGVRAIVVDNNSTDGSGDIARQHGATVVHESTPGFGSACWAGLTAADAPIVAFCDGDGSIDPADLPLVLQPVADGAVDLMLGARRPTPGAMTWHQKLANRALAFELRRRTKAKLTDLGPMRAAHREALLSLGLRDRRSGWPLEMVLKAHRAGWRIAEVGVPYTPRRAGESKVTGTLKGTLVAIRDMGGLLVDR
jgi:glycosyltransferase involved in cell wall biosynthesis